SLGATPLNQPVSGMVGGSGGYLMVAEDGGIFTFGTVAFHGSLGANPPASPVVAVAVIPEAFTGSLLAQLRIAPEDGRSGYSRDLFSHWVNDNDPDSCDARQEVLLDESLLQATRDAGCPVSAGQWFSIYDGVTTTDPSTFDVDHVVALAEAWDSGAAAWDAARRRDYANDLGYAGSLIAVSASSNRSKSDQDPAEWMPQRQEAWCWFATSWTHVKIRWDLSADEAEAAALRSALNGCDATPAPPTVPGSPTQPAPPPPPPAAVTITITGLDCAGERVTVRNDGSQPADLTGWRIHDAGPNYTYTFPGGYSLGAGASVSVKSGGAAGPGELHWMNGFVWNNTGDTAFLVDPAGATRSTRSC
ncbi:MAG: lamin tail domain-containing protein, partial [Actinomycetota bacterium]|nr:lamin tail domain-containing protein [Actinomycetota bacterium]